jgi:transglutaminase-like putative cysteine protease
MIEAIFKRIFHFQEMLLLLSLAALACLPMALSNLVRDASLSLLLPVTWIGASLAWLLAKRNLRNSSTSILLFFFGPLALFLYVGQLGSALVQLAKQIYNFFPAFYALKRFGTPLDISPLLTANTELVQNVLAFGGRFLIWLGSFLEKTRVDDPVARTFAWTLLLWLVAIWAGWQISRHKRLFLGLLPSTILLAWVLNYTNRELHILWIYLALLFFLIGFHSYINTQSRWQAARIDYADSTSLDTLVMVGALSFSLMLVSYFTSTVSIKDMLEEYRERRAGSNTAAADTVGLQPAADEYAIAASFGGLPRSHLVGAGPELSQQLVMTISTGDLPPMSLNSQALVPRYYWRASTYQIYTGSGWANPAADADQINADQFLFEPPQADLRIVNQQVTFPVEYDQLYWSGTLLSADAPFQAVWNHKAESVPQSAPQQTSDLMAALAPLESYEAQSVLLNVSGPDLREASSEYPVWVRKQFMALPESVPERVLSLARELTASRSNPYDRAVAIQTYLRQFPYNLDVPAPPSGRDVADYFLFDLKEGYCDYYASTMVVLARASGLPARLVIGYANGNYNYERAEYIVTENYAHSWVEIYFVNVGWVEFEPTASLPLIIHEDKDVAPPPQLAVPQDTSYGKQVAAFLVRMLSNAWIPLAFGLIAAAVWIGWDVIRLNRLDPVQAIQLVFGRLRRLARPLSGSLPVDQTATQYAFDLRKQLSLLETPARTQEYLSPAVQEVDQLADLYSRSLFAPSAPNDVEARGAIRTWSRLRWRVLLANVFMIKNNSRTPKG